MGADEAVDYNVEKFDDKFQDDKFDVVVDTIGGKLCTGWGIAHAKVPAYASSPGLDHAAGVGSAK